MTHLTHGARLLAMTTAEVLQKARDLIADESRWTHRAFAKDAEGHEVEPDEPSACKWCALGAVYHVLGTNEDPALDTPEPIRALDIDIVGINDLQGHEAVLAEFDRAIAREAS